MKRHLLVSLCVVLVTATLAPAPAAAQDYTLGIDASHHQGEIDWQRVADSGHVFAFYKATEGATFVDKTYSGPDADNRAEAAAVGIPFGAYHFARPQGDTVAAAEADAVSEARHFLEIADPAPGDLLPVLDMEATGGLGPNRLIAWTQAWLDEIVVALDVQPLIYTSPSFWETNLANTTTFAEQGFPLWIAHYTSAQGPRTPAEDWNGEGWAFWQWTSQARVPGIAGNVDENRFAGSDLSPYIIPGAPEPEPSTEPGTPPSNDSPPEISGTTEVGQKLSATTGSWSGTTPISYSFAWRRCDEDGNGCTAVLDGTRQEYRLSPADFGHRMKVTVTATNSAGSSEQDSSASGVVTDTTDPVAPRMLKPRRAQTLKTSLNVQWARAEEDARYDVRYRRTSKAGEFGRQRQLVANSSETSARLRAGTGRTYCFSARATDTAGNTSGWSNERCTVVPVDDRELTASGSWKRLSRNDAYLRSLTRASARGAALTADDVAAREILVVATTCPSCGKVSVLFNGNRVATIDLEGSELAYKQVLSAKRFGSVRRGDVELVVRSARGPVIIDGLVLAVL